MKKVKVLLIILLIAMTYISISSLVESSITVSGKGVAKGIIMPDGYVYFHCDNSNANNCSIEIKPPVN